MAPHDDDELNRLLREWKAPAAPPTLRDRVAPREPWWRWLLAGTIRVPVPVAVGVALLFAVWVYTRIPVPAPLVESEPTVSLADFQPVSQLEPRVVGELK